MQTRLRLDIASLWLATAIFSFFLLPVAAVTQMDAIPVAEAWRHTLAEGDFEAIMRSYDVLEAFESPFREVDAESCTRQADTLDTSLRTNPVSLALHTLASRCATARGNEADAEQHMQRFAELVRHAYIGMAGDDDAPVKVMAEPDIIAFLMAVPEDVTTMYYDPKVSVSRLHMFAHLRDAESGAERLLSFDFIDSLMQVRRKEKFAEFPFFRQIFAQALLENLAETPGSLAASVIAVRTAVSRPDVREQFEALEMLAREGEYGGMKTYVINCLTLDRAVPECATTAMDLLLPWVEKRDTLSLVLLAFVQSHGPGIRRDDRAVKALLDAADRQWGAGRGATMHARMLIGARQEQSARRYLERAAKAGNPQAQVLLAAIELYQPQRTRRLTALQREGLERAAQSGLPVAQALLATYLVRTGGDRDTVAGWMERAAEGGYGRAQHALAHSYAFGTFTPVDLDKTRFWMAKAANSGVLDATLWLVESYRSAADDADTRYHYLGWLRSAAIAGHVESSVELARFIAESRALPDQGPAEAVEIYRELIALHDRADARRGLADLLAEGAEGVESNPAEARRLLLVDAEKGDAESQAQLGSLLLNGTFGAHDPQGLDWLRKSAAQDNPAGLVELGIALYYAKSPASRDIAGALEYWKRAASLGNRVASNNLAWALCTSDVDDVLDPQRGLSIMHWLQEDTQELSRGFTDTLAACHAAAGEFDEAERIQSLVLDRARATDPPPLATIERFALRLATYRQKKRFIEIVDAP